MSRFRCAAALIAAGAITAAVGAPLAAAKPVTMHFYSTQVYARFSDSSGKPLSSTAVPGAGTRLSAASNDYVGNHKHHALRPTASDHVVCTLTSSSTALCDGTFAIGGSLLLGDDFVLDFTSSTTTIAITDGTGAYRHAHGTVHVKTLSSVKSDVTIKLR